MDKRPPTDQKTTKAHAKDILKEFKIKQRDFERKLDFNNNSDPLNLWHQHINWIWENSEIVDNDQRLLINLIEKCIENFAGNSKYKNDIRFYNIFYKYTQITSDPDDVYESINSLSLFDKLSRFYISWSWVLVNLGRETKALEVLNLGIEKKAEPICLLIQAKEEIETKMKEKKTLLLSEQTNEITTSSQVNNSCKALRERKHLSVEPSPSMISFSNRLALSSKSLKKSLKESTTPKENLLLKSSANRQGFEILEEDSDENRQSSSTDQQQANTTITIKNAAKQSQIETNKASHQEFNAHLNTKVKQNLIQKLKPLEEPYKEPKIVIFETLKSNQKFYADLKRIYADNTEYSFEEIRMRKMKKLKKRKESQAHSELIKEIEMLKQKLKENEQREKEKDSLQNQVDILKKQIEMIIASSLTTQNSKRCMDEVDYVSEIDRTKKLKLMENRQSNLARNKLSERSKKDSDKEELTIVRDMWNGTFASQYSPANFNQNQSMTGKDQQKANQRKEQFSIFKDPTTTNFTRTDFSYYPQMCTTANQDCFTIALPRDPSEFNAKLSSTPAANKRRL